MLVWENPAEIGRWIRVHGGGNLEPGTFSAIGYVQNGELVGGVAFSDSNGSHCLVSIALLHSRFPPSLLKASLYYVFRQLALRRVTFIISARNMRSQNLVTRLGARREATLHEAGIEGEDLLIYSLFPRDCAIWSRLNGQRYNRATESRSCNGNPPSRAGESSDVRLSTEWNADQYAGSGRKLDLEQSPNV